ncbi:cupin domain-containing protein [Marinomonas mediterranea]|jgi:Mannose-6-phosphate isomerase|uniref:Cupin 2 conserved barrel domain protein n=1 Tax=Marinomonas mediterranea (strain ATCC 700492 / JCM 21426 / NBRC 103028 / MMB-1) TaxID=717774 RepID=F2JU90_MARM1|nr:cupin domain-containing protein [Marinomonas mediterranea]ADZ91602.1 Cupin 2 conserved barrel domain protein [Marinomonas mediterranea MMB-1]WCN09561.1 cupin domain-containing protein [Marinomonas mediterranea]WCN17702.1 cupin domain-containing protein [Marinomonas mediterranea MMB-1]
MKNIFSHIAKIEKEWFSESIGSPNGNPISVRVMNDMEAKYHTHENSDEMFLVLSGRVNIDTKDGTIELLTGQSHTVLAGVEHRARVKGRAELIVFGGANT